MERLSRKVGKGATIYLAPGERRALEVFGGGKVFFLDGTHSIDRVTLHPGASIVGGWEAKIKCDSFAILGSRNDVSVNLDCLMAVSETQVLKLPKPPIA